MLGVDHRGLVAKQKGHGTSLRRWRPTIPWCNEGHGGTKGAALTRTAPEPAGGACRAGRRRAARADPRRRGLSGAGQGRARPQRPAASAQQPAIPAQRAGAKEHRLEGGARRRRPSRDDDAERTRRKRDRHAADDDAVRLAVGTARPPDETRLAGRGQPVGRQRSPRLDPVVLVLAAARRLATRCLTGEAQADRAGERTSAPALHRGGRKRGRANPDRGLRGHRSSSHRRPVGTLWLLHPRALRAGAARDPRLERRQPDRHPLHERDVEHRRGGQPRLPATDARRGAVADRSRPAGDADDHSQHLRATQAQWCGTAATTTQNTATIALVPRMMPITGRLECMWARSGWRRSTHSNNSQQTHTGTITAAVSHSQPPPIPAGIAMLSRSSASAIADISVCGVPQLEGDREGPEVGVIAEACSTPARTGSEPAGTVRSLNCGASVSDTPRCGSGVNSATIRENLSSGLRTPSSVIAAASEGDGCSVIVVIRKHANQTVIVPIECRPAASAKNHQLPVVSEMIVPNVTTAATLKVSTRRWMLRKSPRPTCVGRSP